MVLITSMDPTNFPHMGGFKLNSLYKNFKCKDWAIKSLVKLVRFKNVFYAEWLMSHQDQVVISNIWKFKWIHPAFNWTTPYLCC